MAGPERGLRGELNVGALDGRRVAILATDGVEEVELTQPRDAVTEAGAIAEIGDEDLAYPIQSWRSQPCMDTAARLSRNPE